MSAVPDWAEPLVDQVAGDARQVIDAELRRLARRRPGLTARDVELIGVALDDLAERLLLARLRSLAAERPDLWADAAKLFERHLVAGPGS